MFNTIFDILITVTYFLGPPIATSSFFHDTKKEYKVVSIVIIIWLWFMFFFTFKFFGTESIESPDDPHILSQILDFLLVTVLWFAPLTIVIAANIEGFMLTLGRFTRFFKLILLHFRSYLQGKTIEEIMNTRDTDKKRKEYNVRMERINKRKLEVEGRLTKLSTENPEVMSELIESIPKDTPLYKGYFGELERRFQEHQIKKTVQATRERVGEARSLANELAGLLRAKADIERAGSEFKMVNTEIETKEKAMEAKLQRVDLESNVKRLTLESKRLSLEKEIEAIKKQISHEEKNEKRPSPEEILHHRVRHNLKIMKEKGIAVKEIEEQKNQTLNNINQQKNPELYRRIKNMYNDLLFEVMERTEK